MTQNKLRSIIVVLSAVALSFPLACAIPDMNQTNGTGDTVAPTDGGGSTAQPTDGTDTATDPANDNSGTDASGTPTAGDNTGGDTTQGDTGTSPGDTTTDPGTGTDTDPGTGDNGGDNGSGPPSGGGTQNPGGGDSGGSAPGGDSIRANLKYEGPDGSRIEMNPLAASLFGAVITPTTVAPSTAGFITFLCDDTISLGSVSFFDAAGGVTTLNDVTFDRGTDFECGRTVTLLFALPSDVSLIFP